MLLSPVPLTGLLSSLTPELREHGERVAYLCQEVGLALGLSPQHLDDLRVAAWLHDLGKQDLSSEMLAKTGPLTPEEWAQIRRHPELGVHRARAVPGLSAGVLAAILSHHERWDGGGYPQGLRGHEIPRLARIIAVCDVYDALRSARVYKPVWTPAAALAEVRRGGGAAFDPEVLAAFLALEWHARSSSEAP
ncbi:HD-GYP domain-containing protein [Deinococcus aquaedulcis]|uniref:HD-GYP domain-containing protein n=1 Tax=Deinococcus aquaedulcis TaxID=2840455 RepID=UPI002E2BC610|nr:HD-GYP domain-containing protein [Deinococcus aquaedulcis]